MYSVVDERGNFIAFHDKLYVIEKYVESIYKLHKVVLTIKEVKKKKLTENNNDDLWLVRYADTYVQVGYLTYAEIMQGQFIEDDEVALNVLYRMLEVGRLTNKETKKILGAIGVLEDIIKEDREYTFTLSQLETAKTDYDPYMYNSGLIQ